jgi:predicted NAD-dependent protein-ADP-ribosyltransferase YbiA (DUF1768 family)
MNNTSYFINNKALFGSYPSQESVTILEGIGVRYFIDLTMDNEISNEYTTEYKHINYPIKDMDIPTNWKSYACFLLKIIYIIKNLTPDEKIYIHCRGGHGRAGIVVASIFCYMYRMDPLQAIENTTICHNNRITMREKWRIMGSPQTLKQKKFILKYFRPIYYNRLQKTDELYALTNDSSYSVYIDKLGLFPNAEAAFQSYKNPGNKEYIKNQQMSNSSNMSIILGNNTEINEDWKINYKKYMIYIIKLKFIQHPELKDRLLNTGLRPLISNDYTQNMVGNILSNIREVLYKHSESP